MKTLENICKPQIVDFLRVCDRRRWVFPRIKYASVRSKPVLLEDIRRHFREESRPGSLVLHPKRQARSVPEILFDFSEKTFLFDGAPVDLPTFAKPEFRIDRGPVEIDFQSHALLKAGLSSSEELCCRS